MRYNLKTVVGAVIIASLVAGNTGYASAETDVAEQEYSDTVINSDVIDIPELKADGDTKEFTSYTFRFDKSNVIGQGSNGYYIGGMIAIKVKSKTMLKINIDPETIANNCYVGLYSSRDITSDSLVTEQGLSMGNNEPITLETYVVSGGTLYIGIKAYGSNSTFNSGDTVVNVQPYYIDGNDRDLAEGEWTLAPKTNNNGTSIYYKFVIKKSSYVTFESDNKGMICAILGSNKSIIENNVLINKSKGYKTTSKLKAGTYYLRTAGYGAREYKIRYTTEDELKAQENEVYWFAPSTSDDYYYIKLEPGMTGYMSVKVGSSNESYRMDMALCDSSQKRVSDILSVAGGYGYKTNNFGVYGGETYYLRLRGDCCKLGIKYTISGIKDIGGKSFSNPKALKLGTKYTSVIANGKKVDKWFSFKLIKNKKIRMDFASSTFGNIEYQVYGNSIKKPIKGGYFKAYGDNITKTLRSKGKFTAGTYRIRVTTNNAYTSGKFSIKVR